MKKELPALNKLLSKFASRQLIEQSSSELNSLLEVVKIGDTVLLNSANTNYSYGGLHRVFQKVFKKLDIQNRQIRDVLILGFGTGSVASILKDELGIGCRIIAVEKDREVIRLGKAHFNILSFSDLTIHEADAATYIAEENHLYDLIIVDVYVDFEVPESCETEAFVEHLKRCLYPGGMVLFNKLVYNHKAGEEAEELLCRFKSRAGKTSVLKLRENVVNKVIVYEDQGGSKGDHEKAKDH